MTDLVWRAATIDDADALLDLERTASQAALGDLFPPSEYPYPSEAVLDRWKQVLSSDGVTVLICEMYSEPISFVAFDDDLIRHLAVRPDHWGQGLATQALRRAVQASSAHRLWCLEGNARAVALYVKGGWRRTGRVGRAEWPPYPREVEFELLSRSTVED